MDASKYQEALRSHYNSPEFSDVTVVLSSTALDKENNKIFAHKIILATGSRAFREYFQSHPKDASSAACEVNIKDVWKICEIRRVTYETVLRHLYGLPPDESRVRHNTERRQICYAARGFGLPDLYKSALEWLEQDHVKTLEGTKVVAEATGVDLFLTCVDDMREWESGLDKGVEEVAIRLCCKHFAQIREEGDLDERHGLCLEMLDYLSSQGNEALG